MLCKCGQEAGESQFVSFEYAGLKFSHMAKDSNTCLECLKKEKAAIFEKYGRDVVFIKDGRIKVKWELFKEYPFGDEAEISKRNRYTRILEWLSILSTRRSGNFVFEPDHLNIRIAYTAKYAFMRLADAIEYGRLVCANRPENWVINLVFEKTLLSKEGVLGLT
jgi:hypothetical protein